MMRRHAIRFGLVGGAATAVHLFCGLTLIQFGLAPLWANAIAFLIAFMISFLGHFAYSFSDQRIDLLTSLMRFALIAISGFALNEAFLLMLVTQISVVPALALGVTTATAAVFTFYLSRTWAFRMQANHFPTTSGGK